MMKSFDSSEDLPALDKAQPDKKKKVVMTSSE